MAENPPLNRFYVLGYSANDKDFPIISANFDPRVAGYKVPEDLSACPDKRYPNHVFTGAQPISGDERVRHVWEILPSPYVPFTRYDDDLGPVQGRRRSVKNEGQVASREADKQVTYEAREGSAIVYTELEEAWSIKTDEDGNSLFPIRDRDFYEPSRGPVQERRQLLVPTGEEVGSLENVDGTITQTSYEPYNDFLSVKIVQTYKVDGPQLVGNSTNNDGQLVTVTTQRKGADGYTPPSPTATRIVEVSREDIESLVERVVDTPEVFSGKSFRVSKIDLTPEKFKAAQKDTAFEQTIEGEASEPTLGTGEFSKSEQQINKFLKRVATNSRAINEAVVLVELVLTPERQIATRTLRLASGSQTFTPSATLIDANVEALGDGRTVKTEVVVPSVFPNSAARGERIDTIPDKFRAGSFVVTSSATVPSSSGGSIGSGNYGYAQEQLTAHTIRNSITSKVENFQQLKGADYDPLINLQIPFTEKIASTVPTGPIEADGIGDNRIVVKEYDLTKISNALEDIFVEFPSRFSMTLPPVLKSVEVLWNKNTVDGESSVTGSAQGQGDTGTVQVSGRASGNGKADVDPELFADFEEFYASNIPTKSYFFFVKDPTMDKILEKLDDVQLWPELKPKSHTFYATITSVGRDTTIGVSGSQSWSESNITTATDNTRGFTITTEDRYKIFKVPSCLHGNLSINSSETASVFVNASATLALPKGGDINLQGPQQGTADASGSVSYSFGQTEPQDIPRSGKYLVDVKIEPYRFGYYRVTAEVLDAEYFDK